MKRIVVYLASGKDGNFRVQQIGKPAQDSAFRLSAKSQQNKIVAREQRVDDLRYYRVLVSVYSGE